MILVTGASHGIGLASAEQFAREGGTVVATDIEIEALEAAVSPLVAEGCRIEAGKLLIPEIVLIERITNEGVLAHDRAIGLPECRGAGEYKHHDYEPRRYSHNESKVLAATDDMRLSFESISMPL